MTRIVTTLALAISLLAGAGTALAQDADVEALRAYCQELEAVQSPALVDCYQALADAAAAPSEDGTRAVVRSFYGTESPYDFQHRIVDEAENAPTLFDAD